MMRPIVPDIDISIVPSRIVDYIAVRARWKHSGENYTHQVVLHKDEFVQRIGRVVAQLIAEIITIEEALNGWKEKETRK